jgi:isocitrate lyase
MPAIARALAYAPFADVLWCETKTPDLDEARRFAEAVHDQYPGKLLAYNCSPSFNWKRHLDDETIARFQRSWAPWGTATSSSPWPAGTSSTWARSSWPGSTMPGMDAYVRVQEREFHLEEKGYTAVKHQREVGGNYFDLVLDTLSHGEASTGSMKESTETAQFG